MVCVGLGQQRWKYVVVGDGRGDCVVLEIESVGSFGGWEPRHVRNVAQGGVKREAVSCPIVMTALLIARQRTR